MRRARKSLALLGMARFLELTRLVASESGFGFLVFTVRSFFSTCANEHKWVALSFNVKGWFYVGKSVGSAALFLVGSGLCAAVATLDASGLLMHRG